MTPLRPLVFVLLLCGASLSVSQTVTRDSNTVAPLRPLTREGASALLLEGNPEIRLARGALQAALADVRRADISPNPTLTASVSNTLPGQYRARESDRIFRLEQLVERGGKRALRTEGARLLESAAQADLADTIRQQRTALAGAYADLAAAQRVEALARDNAEGYTKLVEATQRRLRAGDVAAVDLSRMRVEAARAAQDARLAETETTNARISLGALLGIAEQALRLVATDELPHPTAADATALPPPSEQLEQVVARRADAAAAQARVDAALRARELANRQRTRDVLLGVQTERAPSFGGNVIGVSVSIPLLFGNDYSGDIARAHAEETLAQESLTRARALVRADIERSAERLAAARDRARLSAGQALPEARRAAEGVEFAFARGAAPLTDLFDARRQLAAVQAEATRALAELSAAIEAYRESLSIPEMK